MNGADTAFVLISAALVMLMTPGLALFYGGMVRSKNVLGTLMQNFIMLGVVGVLWALYGYSLAFGPDVGHVIGNLDWIGLAGVGFEPFKAYSETIPHQTFMIYQAMFAIITPALITGAFAERMKFSTFLVFMVIWSTIVYNPVAHWVWGDGGWLKNLGALDFAGGTVVHINAGVAALAAALVMGPRRGYAGYGNGVESFIPHNLPMTILGAGLLWFGWFGFNAGSALGANALASSAFTATHLATCAATLSWVGAEWIHRGKPTTLGAASGAVAGLVAITPAAGYVGPMSAMLIGLIAGVICYLAVLVKPKLGYDDSLDVVGVHCVGGITGALLTGLFATKLVNAAGGDGLFYGNPGQLWTQLIAVGVTVIYSFVISYALFWILDKTMGLRVDSDAEVAGLDLSVHQETGYSL
ncbi:MAG: ammonium transporter [Deltaproteobacteria bacterium]|nr:ammonium transporter [Deltaproteobacteria bacterium]